ncbi:hypothetical protein E4U53_003134 [Claviceps sorghi]|nr:hypothetical protein E4U53_003134 [Claviceps sorghi]
MQRCKCGFLSEALAVPGPSPIRPGASQGPPPLALKPSTPLAWQHARLSRHGDGPEVKFCSWIPGQGACCRATHSAGPSRSPSSNHVASSVPHAPRPMSLTAGRVLRQEHSTAKCLLTGASVPDKLQ